MTLAELLSDLRYVAWRRDVCADDLDDGGAALCELGWTERMGKPDAMTRLRVTLDGLDVIHACRDVEL